MKFYIAGPMTGKEDYNYPAFNRAEQHLASLGHQVINPARMGEKYGTAEEINANAAVFRQLIHDELTAIRDCNGIYLLRGWEKSQGARNELALAIHLGLDIVQQRATR